MSRLHPHRTAAQPPDSIPLLIDRLTPEIEALLAHHRMTQEDAEGALHELLLLLTYRWDQLESREIWTLSTLKRLCLRHSARAALEL